MFWVNILEGIVCYSQGGMAAATGAGAAGCFQVGCRAAALRSVAGQTRTAGRTPPELHAEVIENHLPDCDNFAPSHFQGKARVSGPSKHSFRDLPDRR